MAISASNKNPGAYFEIFFGAGRQSPGVAPRRVVLTSYGGLGTGSDDTLYGPHASADDVLAIHGGGTPLHLGAIGFFEEYPDGAFYTMQLAAAAGATATEKTLTITNNLTAGGALTIDINSFLVPVALTAGLTPTQQAAAIVAELDKYPYLPVTSTAALGVVTFVTKWKGPTSQQFQLRYATDGNLAGSTYVIATTVSGATDKDPTTALDALDNLDVKYIVVGIDHNAASTGLSTYLTVVNNRAKPEKGLRGCLIAAFTGSLANAITLSTSQNAHREQIVWDRGSNMFTIEIAAKIAALRARYEQDDPTVNLILNGGNNRVFTNWRIPTAYADRITVTESNNALNAGLTPIQYTQNTSQARIVRPITTRFQDLNGGADYRTLDVIKVNMLDWYADELASDFHVRFPNYKLQPEDDAPVIDGVADRRLIKSWALGFLYEYAANGWVKNVAVNEANVVVSFPIASPGRASLKVPVDVIDLFAQLDANLYQVG